MAFIHQCAKLFNFLILGELCGLACGFKVMHSLALCKDMHGPLVEEELGILSAHFFNVGNIIHQLEAVVNVALLLDLRWSIAARSKLLCDNFKHSLFVLIQSYFKLLECLDRSFKEV